MNHTRNAIRFGIAIFWLVVLGLAYTAYNNASNAHAIGWATWLVYGIAATVTTYAGVFATKHFWSYK